MQYEWYYRKVTVLVPVYTEYLYSTYIPVLMYVLVPVRTGTYRTDIDSDIVVAADTRSRKMDLFS